MDHEQSETIVVDQASQGFIGQWNQLISTTNWQKGRIIFQWRAALMEAGAPPAEYADETWSRLVGGLSGQHAGRLRRVYERFGDVFTQYEGLYWSHFCAAMDWDDAEMWLEGAVQNRWSVAGMRRQRWETMGAVPEDEPREADAPVATELDEDFDEETERTGVRLHDPTDSAYRETHAGLVTDDYTATALNPEGPDFGDADEAEAVPPFANLSELPEDLAEPFEAFQLAILRHKSLQWSDVALADVLAALDALKALALAPSA
jgi:hypothetical protein